MLDRCYNTTNIEIYSRYGARGIEVCERWRNSFEDFLADMGPRPPGTTLDRWPDNDGNYQPGNCRWATRTEQQNNRRGNVIVTVGPLDLTISEWCRVLGLHTGTVLGRMSRGYSPRDAVFKPIPLPSNPGAYGYAVKPRGHNSTGVNGVSWYAKSKSYRAQIYRGGRIVHLGYFKTVAEAAAARMAAEALTSFD